MKNVIKKRQGLPFLLALGVLFILSATFLAVQFWSDDTTLRGAAAALEAPVLPPSLNLPKVVPPPAATRVKKVKPAKEEQKPVAEPKTQEKEVAKVKEPVKVVVAKPEVKKVVKEAKKEEVKKQPVVETKPEPVKKPVEVKVKTPKAEVKPVAPAVVLKKAAAPKKVIVKPVVKKVVVEPKAEVKPVKKAAIAPKKPVVKTTQIVKKSRRKASRVETEIPPEWNWFSKPLKFNIEDGKAKIEPKNGKKIVLKQQKKALVKTAVVKKKTQKRVAKTCAPKKIAKPETKKVAKVSPFKKALVKIQKTKAKRQQYAKKHGIKLPSKSKAPLKVSPSLRRILELVKQLKEKASDNDESISVESTEANVTADTVACEPKEDVKDTETSVQEESSDSEYHSYEGSGSSFGLRVKQLIRSGAWLRSGD
jgi:hypothetical protein